MPRLWNSGAHYAMFKGKTTLIEVRLGERLA